MRDKRLPRLIGWICSVGMIASLVCALTARGQTLVYHLPLDDTGATATLDAEVGPDAAILGGDTADELTAQGPGENLPLGIALEGDGDRIRVDGLSITTYPVTLTCWVRQTQANSQNAHFAFLTNSASATSYAGAYVLANGQIYVRRANPTDAPILSGGIWRTGHYDWQHLALVFDSDSAWTLYKNGSRQGAVTGQSAVTLDADSLLIGAGPNYAASTHTTAAVFSDMRVYEGALTQQQIIDDLVLAAGFQGNGPSYQVGNSLTNDTLPTLLPGNLYHVDCGVSLWTIYNSPLLPCVGDSMIWPVATQRKRFSWISLQPYPSESIDQFVTAATAILENQPDAKVIIHSNWAAHADIATEYVHVGTTTCRRSPAWMNALMARLATEFPDREFVLSKTYQMLYDIYTDCQNETAPFESVDYLYRDTVHLTDGSGNDGAGRYLAHNTMRRIMGLPYAEYAACTATEEIKSYLRSKIEAYHDAPKSGALFSN